MKTHKPRILIIDNEDSFTWNLVQLVEECGANVFVSNPGKLCTTKLPEFDGIIISPGPGLPDEMNGLMEFMKEASVSFPMLGICLGHQAIAMCFGAKLHQLSPVIHGKNETIQISQSNSDLFSGLSDSITVGLYHSWAVDSVSLPKCFEITAISNSGTIMGIKHKTLPLFGLQFHPESYITADGKIIINHWLNTLRIV